MKLIDFLLDRVEKPPARPLRTLPSRNGRPGAIPPIEPRRELVWVQGEPLGSNLEPSSGAARSGPSG